MNDSQLRRLLELLDPHADSAHANVSNLALHHEAGPLIGHVMLDVLEEAGFGADDISAVGAMSPESGPISAAIMHAAATRGLDLDSFIVDESNAAAQSHMVGPSISGKNVAVVSATATRNSILRTAAAVRASGGKLVAVGVVVDLENGAQEAAESGNLTFVSAIAVTESGKND